MDTMEGIILAQIALADGAKFMVFDWHKAARRILETSTKFALGGLKNNWEWTGACIYTRGEPVKSEEVSIYYFGSIHAAPELQLDSVLEDCWIYQDESDGWNGKTWWPESALKILKQSGK